MRWWIVRHPELADDVIVAAVEAAYEDDAIETDCLGGGVPPTKIHEYLPAELSYSQLQDRLRELANDEKLDRVSGADPESLRPRWSYLPVSSDDE